MQEKDKQKTKQAAKPESKPNEKEAWDSGIKILKKISVIIPMNLLLVCNRITEKVNDDEFSIVTSIEQENDTVMRLSDKYYIPKQIVSSMSIEYLPDQYRFDTVIHRHPDGFNSFSVTDQEYINRNFRLSVLYTKENGFVNGVYNLKYKDYIIPVPVKIIIDYGIDEIDVSNIKKPAPVTELARKLKDKSKMRIEGYEEPDTSENMFPEEKLDYGLMKRILLEEVQDKLEEIDSRLSTVEDCIYNGYG